ncbi:hypothetical protein FJT64_016102 [Amphibalanus amphitrite]|uniref:Apple domain-containing protein n=1 Tax=Amphibalanus amphitrite TaxID=1232801 RepID=A0A6A4XAQ0_AMPAM|nr:hypothetical protein FJT64_016102 [Amphibalanus amphitrite]
MRAVLALLAALLARWPAALGQQPATLSSQLSGTLPPETFAVRPAPFLVASRGHLVSASDELGRAPADTECECLTRCFLNDQCFSFSYEPASSDCRLGWRRGHRNSTEPGSGLFRVRPGLARLDDFCWSDDECSRVTPASRCQDAVCVAGDGSDGTAGTAGGMASTEGSAATDGSGEEQHVEPPTGLKCNLHTDGAAVSLVSDARDRWTAAPVSAAGEVSVCPADTVVTGLFDTSGRLETVELLLCAPLVDGMLVSDRCYNLPTKPNSGWGTQTAEAEGSSQCHLVAGEAWAVVGLAINTDGTDTWVGALRCCRVDAA